MNEPVDQVPPIRIDALDGNHMLVMQSPNPGWSISIDKHERIAEGEQILITVRRPDPAFMYTQNIVEKRVLTEISGSTNIVLFARVLEFGEKAGEHGYGRLTPVENFQD